MHSMDAAFPQLVPLSTAHDSEPRMIVGIPGHLPSVQGVKMHDSKF